MEEKENIDPHKIIEEQEEGKTKKKIKSFFKKVSWGGWVAIIAGLFVFVFLAAGWMTDENALTEKEKVFVKNFIQYPEYTKNNWTKNNDWDSSDTKTVLNKLREEPKDIQKNIWLLTGIFITIIILILISKKEEKYEYLSLIERMRAVNNYLKEKRRMGFYNHNTEWKFLDESATKQLLREAGKESTPTMGYVGFEMDKKDGRGWREYLARIDPKRNPTIPGFVLGIEEVEAGFKSSDLELE